MKYKTLHEPSKYYFIKIRPHFQEFLKEVSKDYDIYVYTRLTEEFALRFLKEFDKKHLIKKAICRQHH